MVSSSVWKGGRLTQNYRQPFDLFDPLEGKHENEIDTIAKARVRKPKKVKPGYKRAMKWEMDKIKKKERRKRNRQK